MAEQQSQAPVFDPIKLERLKVESEYPMEKDDFNELFYNGRYCEMAHINSKGYPIVTPMFYVVINDHVHLSSIKGYRYKVHALEKRPKMTVCIHNDGMILRHQKSILVVGQARVSDDEELRKKVHWTIIDKYWFDAVGEQRQAAFEAIHTPLRAIIEVIPEKIISWDFGKMVKAYDPGVWFKEAYNFPTPGGAADKKK
jgi:nitroimidazol reductase NimA-like FMN-containing flavoprotein (pyridoxamine 5'-phosphate oxidase superfamily)